MRADPDFGDNTSRWANDGECDDPRFEGAGAADTLLVEDRGHDAADCRKLFGAGRIALRDSSANAAGMFFVTGQWTRASVESRIVETQDFNRLPSPPVSVDTTGSLVVIDALASRIVGDLTRRRARVHGSPRAKGELCSPGETGAVARSCRRRLPGYPPCEARST